MFLQTANLTNAQLHLVVSAVNLTTTKEYNANTIGNVQKRTAVYALRKALHFYGGINSNISETLYTVIKYC